MKMHSLFLFISLLFFNFEVSADPVVKLNQLMTGMATLQADFNLEIRNQVTDEIIDINKGKLKVKRPGFFNVHTRDPFEQFLISDQKVIWSYDVELEQASRDAVDERLQQTPFLLLSGDAEAIRENFSVNEPIEDGKNITFALSPTAPDASYGDIQLVFADSVLTTMQWTNSLGEKAKIDFSEISVNKELNNSLFQFEPPQGVDVVINE